MATGNPNQDIIDMLQELAKIEIDAGVIVKFRAYHKAIQSICEYPTRFKSGAEAQKNLKFIGPSIAKRIDDFLADQNNNNSNNIKLKADKENGKQTTSSNKNEDNLKLVDCLDRIIGLDREKLFCLSFANIHTIGDLRVKGLNFMNPALEACLKHFSDLNNPINIEEVKKYKKAIRKIIEDDEDKLAFDLVGTCRRAADSSERFYSIDVLFTDRTIKSTSANCAEQLRKTSKYVAKAFRKAGLVAKENIFKVNDQATSATSHYDLINVLVKLSEESPMRRVNLHFVVKDMRVVALFTLTGSEQFVQNTKQQALEHGYLLDMSLGGLRRLGYTNVPGEPIHLFNEKELFEYIDTPFVPPEDRNVKLGQHYPMEH